MAEYPREITQHQRIISMDLQWQYLQLSAMHSREERKERDKLEHKRGKRDVLS